MEIADSIEPIMLIVRIANTALRIASRLLRVLLNEDKTLASSGTEICVCPTTIEERMLLPRLDMPALISSILGD